MPFTKTTWVDGSEPFITADQLNRIEQGVDDAHAGVIDKPIERGFVDFAGAERQSVGTYRVPHSLGTSSLVFVGTVWRTSTGQGTIPAVCIMVARTSTYVDIQTWTVGATPALADCNFDYVIARR